MEKRILSKGKGLRKPCNRSKVKAEVECRLINEGGEIVIKKGIYEITLEEADEEVWDDVEDCLMSMQSGEESVFNRDNPKRWYRIRLLTFEAATDFWKLDAEERVGIAVYHKLKGNELFNEGNIKPAACRYCKALRYLISVGPATIMVTVSDKPVNLRELKLQCLLNVTLCHLKSSHYEHAIDTASKVLKLDNGNAKALYRRGVANLELGNIEDASNDLLKAKEHDPNNKAINDQLLIAQHRLKASDLTLQHAMKKMFDNKK